MHSDSIMLYPHTFCRQRTFAVAMDRQEDIASRQAAFPVHDWIHAAVEDAINVLAAHPDAAYLPAFVAAMLARSSAHDAVSVMDYYNRVCEI